MTDQPTETTREPEEADVEEPVSDEALAEQERAMAALLRGVRAERPIDRRPRLLPGVQRKLRERSRGKFFGDGWSTSQTKLNYGLVAMAMLLVIAIAYFVLGPTGF